MNTHTYLCRAPQSKKWRISAVPTDFSLPPSFLSFFFEMKSCCPDLQINRTIADEITISSAITVKIFVGKTLKGRPTKLRHRWPKFTERPTKKIKAHKMAASSAFHLVRPTKFGHRSRKFTERPTKKRKAHEKTGSSAFIRVWPMKRRYRRPFSTMADEIWISCPAFFPCRR